MIILVTIAIIALLIFINGLYVAAEFSAVSSRRPRLAQLAEEGSTLAGYILGIVENPRKLDTYVAACQLGITVSSLLLGYYGQSQFMSMIEPYVERLAPTTQVVVRSASATVILLTLTVFQVVLGELVPKNVGIQYPEKLATITAPAMRWSIILFQPLIWIFNGSGQLILRLIGASQIAEHVNVHSPEEILILVEESSEGGVLDAEERRLLVNTLQLRHLTARKVMIPRNRMLTASLEMSCADLFKLLADSPFSRLPLYDGNIDSIVGVVHLKDLIRAQKAYLASDTLHSTGQHETRVETDCSPGEIMHSVLHLPDTVEVEEVMEIMQREHQNLVIVVDEYGGTAGMITFEDLVEEIIGEFQDEFDVENPPLEVRPNNRLRVRGDVQLHDLEELLDLSLQFDEVDTIGGLVLATIGRIPKAGDTVDVGDVTIRVDRVVGNSVSAVSFPIAPEEAERISTFASGI